MQGAAKPLLVLLFVVAVVVACGRQQGAPRAPLQLEVMSFNIRWEIAGRDGSNGWPRRRELVFALLRDPELDVVGLQEATPDQLADILAAVPALAVHDSDPRMNGIAILYRRDRLRLEESGAWWFSPTPDVPESRDWNSDSRRHVCAHVRLVDIATGRAFHVFDLHLDSQESSRRRSAILLAERVAGRSSPDPVLVLGDFNAGEDEAASRYLPGEIALDSAGETRRTPVPLVDSFRVLQPDAQDVGTAGGFVGRTSGPKIDFIYVAAGTSVLAASIDRFQVGAAYPSDHFPVRATILLPDPVGERGASGRDH